jgi:DNA-binding CsgD family transcriptional regulator
MRQIEVLTWVARGKTNAEIAKILGLKPKTIGKYLERIYPKLGVENRTAAASFILGSE